MSAHSRTCYRWRTIAVGCFCNLALALQALAQPQNSNHWPVHRDDQFAFRVSYPPNWKVVATKGINVRFSVNPPEGPGNCNVVARPSPDLEGFSQTELNKEVTLLPRDEAGWAEYTGLSQSAVRVVEARAAQLQNVSALVGVVQTSLENLQAPYHREQMIAIMLTPGVFWSINCGASSFSVDEAQTRFAELRPTFDLIFGSFGFLSGP